MQNFIPAIIDGTVRPCVTPMDLDLLTLEHWLFGFSDAWTWIADQENP
jgi:hypothetical protein